ncbi:hypothetical protein SANT12839_034900 [Streptomyces antimycoticus]|uniref:Uncharacterized protein n=1 Tax=Streptomyces antimycoticus TaxID=68175 RepID=A0A4D4K7G9_9ACTN|nr:hypothetical protein SANT12839_034900 [Streptomyces antimycoticus]
MSFPELPQPAPGEVLLVCTCYKDGEALWGGLIDGIGGRREGDALILGAGCGSAWSKAADGTTCTAVTYRRLSRAAAPCRPSSSWRTSLWCTAGTGRCWWTWR